MLYHDLTITRGPVAVTAHTGDVFSLDVDVSGGGAIAYQWSKGDMPLADDDRITGSATNTLVIREARLADAGAYRVEVSNACGTVESEAAVVGVICLADLNGDGVVDFGDYMEFLTLYGRLDPGADLNRDGVVDFADYLVFLNAYDAGC